MNKLAKPRSIAIAGIAAVMLAGCGGSGSDAPAESTGLFNLSISDGPIKDAAKICIKFDGVQLKKADEEAPTVIEFEPQMVNLLANQGANSQPIVTNELVEAGQYEWIRLMVDASRGSAAAADDGGSDDATCSSSAASYLVNDTGEVFNLFIPSGEQSGLKLISNITVPVNNSANYTAEWDLGKSLIAPPGLAPDVLMKPVIKIVSNDAVGTLVGRVDDALVDAETCDDTFAPSVYVFPNGATPNSIDFPAADSEEPFVPPADDPVATGMVEQQMQDTEMQYRYSIGFLVAEPEPYVAAFTCDGENFVPVDGKDALIEIGEVTEVDFTVEDAPST